MATMPPIQGRPTVAIQPRSLASETIPNVPVDKLPIVDCPEPHGRDEFASGAYRAFRRLMAL